MTTDLSKLDNNLENAVKMSFDYLFLPLIHSKTGGPISILFRNYILHLSVHFSVLKVVNFIIKRPKFSGFKPIGKKLRPIFAVGTFGYGFMIGAP